MIAHTINYTIKKRAGSEGTTSEILKVGKMFATAARMKFSSRRLLSVSLVDLLAGRWVLLTRLVTLLRRADGKTGEDSMSFELADGLAQREYNLKGRG